MLIELLALMLVGPEGPQDPGLAVTLRWQAPPPCATQAEVVADIEALAEAPVVAGGSDAQVVDARIEAQASGYTLQLTRTTAAGAVVEQRALEASDCGVLSRATALIVAVSGAPLRVSAQIDRLQRASVEPAPPVEPSDPAPEAPDEVIEPIASEPIAPPPIETAAAKTRPSRLPDGWRHRFIAGGWVGLAVGAVPRATATVGGWAGYALGPLRVELSGMHAFSQSRELQTDVAIAVRSSGGAAMVMFAPRLGPIVGLVGTGFRAGVVRGQGEGSAVDGRVATDWWAEIPLVAGAAWPRDSRIALRGQVEFAISMQRPSIVIFAPGGGDVGGFRRRPTTLTALLGPEIRLP